MPGRVVQSKEGMVFILAWVNVTIIVILVIYGQLVVKTTDS